jgi:hypothetical protein
VLDQVTVGEAMQSLPLATVRQPVMADGDPASFVRADTAAHAALNGTSPWPALAGRVLRSRAPQAVFTDEILSHALRQLSRYGRDGLPVVSADRRRLCGWITNRNVIEALEERLRATAAESEQGELAAEFASDDAAEQLHSPRIPLRGYAILEITITEQTAAAGREVGQVSWPEGSVVVATTHRGRTRAAREDTRLCSGDRLTVLAPLERREAEEPGGVADG